VFEATGDPAYKAAAQWMLDHLDDDCLARAGY
jgi:hypothetical protein